MNEREAGTRGRQALMNEREAGTDERILSGVKVSTQLIVNRIIRRMVNNKKPFDRLVYKVVCRL